MNENYNFLPLFITEELYFVGKKAQVSHPATEHPATATVSVNSPTETTPTTSTMPTFTPTAKPTPLVVYGENKKKVVILVDEPTADFLRSENFAFLQKIMEAVQYSQHEYALINKAENPLYHFEQMLDQCSPRKIVAFGEGFGLPAAKKYQHFPLPKAAAEVLCADTLTDLRTDVSKKRDLWSALQKFFY